MGKKYIIELLDNCPSEFKGIIVFGLTPSNQISAKPIPVEDLTPYTEPDLEQVRKEAYKEGREAGIKDGKCEAWEAARKIWDYDLDTLKEIFGKAAMRMDIYKLFTASEVIEKLKAYEHGTEIKVGDEAENAQTGVKFIVTHLWKNNRGEQGVSRFNRECSAFSTTLSLVVKTGRHFPEIASVLEKMRENT